MPETETGWSEMSLEHFDVLRQGSKAPWRLYQNYALDILSLRFGAVNDGAMQFARAESMLDPAERLAA
jgi:hypothetical protein